MAYDANLDATFNPSVGGTPTAAWGDLINANFAYLGAAWTTYTPTWSGTIGNGAITGAYRKVGRTVDFRISVVWGSTTSHAAANQTFTVPSAPHAFYVLNCPIGTGTALDASVAVYDCTAIIVSGSTIVLQRDSNNAAVSNTAPFTFGNADSVFIIGTYEAAA